MLVLSRRVNEAIQIGPDVRVVVVGIDRGKVQLGIEAPRGIPIFREELLPVDSTCGEGTGPTAPEPQG